MAGHKPNILFLIADDHRFSAIGALGKESVHTSALDSLVAEGTTFTNTYMMGSTSGAVCIPGRGMMLTGCSLFRAFDRLQNLPHHTIPAHNRLLPELLREYGYTTHAIGKWHNRRDAFVRSFSSGAKIFFGGMSDHHAVPVYDFDPAGEYPEGKHYIGEKFSTEMFADAAVQFLNSYSGEAPFFLYVAFTSPHDPRTPPPPYDTMYDPIDIPLPQNFYPEHPFDNGEMRIRDELLAPFPRTPEVIRQHIADYYGMISHQDAQIGRILATLQTIPYAANTLVVYVADHGLAVGQHGLMGKQNLYDHSIHPPLIIAGRNIPEGKRVDALCYAYDLFPTLCELTDIPIPKTNEGLSMVSLMMGEKTVHRDSIFAAYQRTQHERENFQRMVRKGDLKLIEYNVAENRHTQLFDLASDPYEMNNRSDSPEYAQHLEELSIELAQWRQLVNDPTLHKGAYA
jgi:arylsulfatase A-like enzyme